MQKMDSKDRKVVQTSAVWVIAILGLVFMILWFTGPAIKHSEEAAVEEKRIALETDKLATERFTACVEAGAIWIDDQCVFTQPKVDESD